MDLIIRLYISNIVHNNKIYFFGVYKRLFVTPAYNTRACTISLNVKKIFEGGVEKIRLMFFISKQKNIIKFIKN